MIFLKMMIIKKNENNLWVTYENDELHSDIHFSLTKDESGESTLKVIHGSKIILHEN